MASITAEPLMSTSAGKGLDHQIDLEAGQGLYPGITVTENEQRWGFIRKVYGIVGLQLALTAIVGSCFALIDPVREFALTSSWFGIVAMIAPFPVMIPLWIYRQSHPLNLAILAAWTACLSITTGLVCSFYSGPIVAQALVLTAVVVLSLTAYTFYAVKKGQDFGFLGPMLFTLLWGLIAASFLQFFFPFGDMSSLAMSFVGAMVFSGYIIYDTNNLLKKYSYDEFVWASVNLYLDIINLFLEILKILDRMQR